MNTALRTSVIALMCLILLAARAGTQTIPTTDVLGVHDLSSGNSPLHGPNANACIYCHAPHNALASPSLWNQTLSTNAYILHPDASTTPAAPTKVGQASLRCLSCHDGSVGVGRTVGSGALRMTGTFPDKLGTQLAGSHPFSIQPKIKDNASLAPSLAASHTTRDKAVSLVENNIECPTCHDVHNQYKDLHTQKFLVRDNAGGRLCLSCHDVGARTVGGVKNALAAWPNSAHAQSTVAVSQKARLGGYGTVKEMACSSCHSAHNALGKSLLRKKTDNSANVDETTQSCITCHDGSNTLAQPILNVIGAFNGSKGHPFADANNPHVKSESIVLDRNRHATCVDCHDPHAAQATTTFSEKADLRVSQLGVAGVAKDGMVAAKATYQYENCLRCHGASQKKQSLPAYGYMPARALFPGDTLDVSSQFAHGATSSHPVMRVAANLARPSLLQARKKGGSRSLIQQGKSQILCTDCHNNDNARESGGTGPNGPHGSKYDHILERQYVMSQVAPGASPGSFIVNLNPTPVLDSAPASPYALCAKCHDLDYINSSQSWNGHGRHIQKGFSCSVCHSAHGTPAGTSGVTGSAMVSFDMNVVGSNNGRPVSYNGASCTLRCHEKAHP